MNVPVSCGGVHVNPVTSSSEILTASSSSRQDAEEVLEAVKAFQQNDRRKLQAAIDGTADRSWVMKQLEAKKCEFRDGVCG